MTSNKKNWSGPLLGAAFLMATSAIGPGFLNNTAVYTQKLGAAFGFVILLSMFIDIGTQWNIWRIVTGAGKPAQDLANEKLYGSGHLLAGMVSFGGLVFNIGNLAGCGLGFQLLTGLSPLYGAAISAALAIALFLFKEFGVQMDRIAKLLGLLMILLMTYVAWTAAPPLREVWVQTFWPSVIDWNAVVVLVGGTVGGYISFAGAHRLLDAGLVGEEHKASVARSSTQGILLTTLMRLILFLAAYGVVAGGTILDKDNPAASVFQSATGSFGMYFFGIVLWCAGITSVVGASYTSVSFWRTLSPLVRNRESYVLSIFILLSLMGFIWLGKPTQLLIMAGAVNGVILPFALAILLFSVPHTLWRRSRWTILMYGMGWLVVLLLSLLSVDLIRSAWEKLIS